MSTDKQFLEETLALLLGFEDGASDVLDHLLSIESENDLHEYLTQLLGDTTPAIINFVANVGQFQRNEPLSRAAQDKIESGSTSTPIEAHTIEFAEPTKQLEKKKKANKDMNNRQSRSRVPPPKGSSQKKSSDSSLTNTPRAAVAETSQINAQLNETQPTRVVKKSRPLKGKASKTCGCFGTIHEPLTNCLYCGRISCMEEGYDFCSFCGYMVENVDDGQDHTSDPNWERKERLLRFDREFAKRTEIFDDQADYQGPSTWMTAEDQQKAEDNQIKQQEALKRPKQTINLSM